MTPKVYSDILTKEILPPKKVLFLLICLHLHLIDPIRKQKFVEIFLYSFIHFFERFFHFSLQTCT